MADERRPSKSRTDLLWLPPLIGVLLLTPPVLAVFDRPVTILGMPILFVYLFFVWFCGILLTGFAARHAPDETPMEVRPIGGLRNGDARAAGSRADAPRDT